MNVSDGYSVEIAPPNIRADNGDDRKYCNNEKVLLFAYRYFKPPPEKAAD